MLLLVIYLLIVPASLMLLARRWRWIDRVSPMTVLYIIGLLVANLTPWMDKKSIELTNMIGNLCVPLALPLMLMSCNLNHWSTSKVLKAFGSGLIAVMLVTLAGFYIFSNVNDATRMAQVSAVAIGIYTGGIPNMGAIAKGVGMDSETFLYVTSYDLIVTGLYLTFVILGGKTVFRRLLPATQTPSSDTAGTQHYTPTQPNSKKPLGAVASVGISLPIAIAIAAVSYVISTRCPDNLSTPVLILLITTLSIGISFLPAVRHLCGTPHDSESQPYTFRAGLYFVYVFCFSIANSCNVSTMHLAGSLNILWYIFFIVVGSLLLQILFSRLLHLDGDTTLTTSVALINSPPFVPLVAALLGNREVIILGISIGLLGYMIGNYLGIATFFLLCP